MTRYRLAGIVLETDWPIVTKVPTSHSEPPDLNFRVVTTPPSEAPQEPLCFDGVGDLWMLSDQDWLFHLTHPEHNYQVEVYLLGVLLSLWLEERGIAVLHGSAVTVGAHAVGFLGPNGAGKTSLALALIDTGERLLTDDLLAVAVRDGVAWAEPTFPQVRLWPDAARRRLGVIDGLTLAHPQYEKLRVPLPATSFSTEPAPLSALYLPRRGYDIGFDEVPGPGALFSLMSQSFAPRLSDRPKHRPAWLARTAALLEHTSVYTLTYPEDIEALPEVAAAVRNHSASVVQSKLPGGTPGPNGA